MSDLPKWVKADMEAFPIPGTTYDRLFKALSIAWEALEYVRSKGSQERPLFLTPNAEVCDKALRRIEELGRGD
jgi:hypothetical protein